MPRHSGQRASKNLNWKGGRTVTSKGYVLVKMPGHPLADCRGYVYEHRLVAERMIGRSLLPGEQVHHRDGNKANNDPTNLEVMTSWSHHAVRHRTRSDKRMPGEPNPNVSCACGCGEIFTQFDQFNRPRIFVSGHNYTKGALHE